MARKWMWKNSTRNASTGASAEQSTPFSTYLFFGVPIATTFSLGVWQIYRLNRKYKLIEERSQRMAMPLLTDLEDAGDMDYRQIEISGTLLHDKEMLVGPRSAPKSMGTPVLQWGGSSGLLVVTPLQLDSGKMILINRGWIPQRLTDRSKRVDAVINPFPFLEEKPVTQNYSEASDSTYTTIRGVVRKTDETNRFTPKNVPLKNEWYHISADDMLPDGDKHVIELTQPAPNNGWPFPRPLETYLEYRTPPETHITYATTWLSLCFFLSLLTRQRLNKR